MGIMDKISKKKAPAKAAKAAKKTEASTEAKAAVAATEVKGESYRILVKPVISEKAVMLQAGGNQYTFEVAKKATKVDVARAIRELYGVKPTQVRIINVEGKAVRFGRSLGREKDVKKAVVTLKQGETISL